MEAMVKTWNGDHVMWGPMSLDEAIQMAADSNAAHRYVEVADRIVYDHDAVVADAEAAVRMAAHNAKAVE